MGTRFAARWREADRLAGVESRCLHVDGLIGRVDRGASPSGSSDRRRAGGVPGDDRRGRESIRWRRQLRADRLWRGARRFSPFLSWLNDHGSDVLVVCTLTTSPSCRRNSVVPKGLTFLPGLPRSGPETSNLGRPCHTEEGRAHHTRRWMPRSECGTACLLAVGSLQRRESPGRGLAKRVRLCQRLLKRPVDDAGDLAALSIAELRDLADRLERDLIA